MFETHTFDEAESDVEDELHRQTEIYLLYITNYTKKSQQNIKSYNSLKSLTLPREKLSKNQLLLIARRPTMSAVIRYTATFWSKAGWEGLLAKADAERVVIGELMKDPHRGLCFEERVTGIETKGDRSAW